MWLSFCAETVMWLSFCAETVMWGQPPRLSIERSSIRRVPHFSRSLREVGFHDRLSLWDFDLPRQGQESRRARLSEDAEKLRL